VRWFRRPLKLGLVVGALGVFLGLLIWVATWLRPLKQTRIVLIGSDYKDNLALPINVYGWQGLEDLANLGVEPRRAHRFLDKARNLYGTTAWNKPQTFAVGDDWSKGLDRVQEPTLIVFLALHGGADREGAYLLPEDAGMDNRPENRLRLTQVLNRLASLPAEKNKILILEATQMRSNWALGMLTNDFARELERLEDRIVAIPNLVVLSSSAPDQASQSSPEWRQTAFTHFLARGLEGEARDLDNDSQISVWELFDYVEKKVSRWVWATYQTVQTPVLLPRGEEGKRRASRIKVTRSELSPTAYEEPPEFEVPAELQAAWQRYRTWTQQVPPPWVNSPTPWRLYRDTLLRYEALVCAGSSAAAADMASRLPNLEQTIRNRQRIDLASVQNSLAMPAAVGLGSGGPPPEVVQHFNELWNAAPPDQAKIWNKLQTATRAEDLPLLRLQLYDLLLAQVTASPVNRMSQAANLLRVLADPVNPRPVEIQFLLLLQRDLPDPAPPVSLLRLALTCMAQAEKTGLNVSTQAYPYSEQVNPWIQPLLQSADQQRRLGLDLVIGSDPTAWNKAESFLQEARRGYEKASAQGAIVRTALAQRDRALEWLPDYSRWAATRASQAPADQAGKPDLVPAIESLWTDVYQLVRMLEKPDPALLTEPAPGEGKGPAQNNLAAQAEVVDRGLDQVENQFGQFCLRLLNSNAPSVQRDVTDVLLVSAIEPGLRMQLLAKGRGIARKLLLETRKGSLLDMPANALAGQTLRAKELARNQGRMALGVLGRAWFEMCRNPEDETYQQARHRLDTFLVEDAWWQSIAQVGGDVGRCVQHIPAEIAKQRDRAQGLPDADALAALRLADRLSRVDAGGGPLPMAPSSEVSLRQLNFYLLLRWLAQRTLEDHWYGLDPTDDPYYRVAGSLHLDDARRMAGKSQPRQQTLDRLQGQLNLPGALALEGKLRYQVTSQLRFSIDYQLQPPADSTVPPGYPVFWFQPGKQLQILAPEGTNRLVRQVGQDAGPALRSIRCELSSPVITKAEETAPPTPALQTATLQVSGRFRGQQITRQTLIDLYPTPDSILYRYPLPLTGSVAVRATEELRQVYGASSGSVVFVLDCSGSMGPPEGQAWGPTTKYNEATRALRQVLQQLPRGVTVSLWVFGQAVGSNKTVTPVEDTIREIQTPITWNPDDSTQLQELLAKVEYPALEPWNETPLVATLVKAREELRGVKGFKTIVAITDGRDNRFANDRRLNPDGLDISAFLTQTFRDSGIVLNLIAFKLATPADREIKDQFKVIEELPLPGKLIEVNDATELGGTLQRSARQAIRFQLDRVDNVPLPRPLAELASSSLDRFDQWYPGGLSPGVYKLRALTDQRVEKDIAINRGKLLLVDLVQTSDGGVFRRALYAPSRYPFKPYHERSGSRASVLQSQAVGTGGLEMMVTLEKTPDPREDLLQVLSPRWTWLEVKPRGVGERLAHFSQRWGNLAGYPAPAWDLRVPAWPGAPGDTAPSGNRATTGGQPARPQLRLWWNPDQNILPSGSLDRNADFRSPSDINSWPLLVDADEVRIDGVSFEDHLVEVRPGVTETQPCLVVRVRHAPFKPVWAEVRGVPAVGQEHRFYAEAGQYTGLFWPVTRQQADLNLESLSLFSVNVFKRDAERRGFTAELDNLRAPDSADVRPRPPVTLR
jgi:hypothetical protein